MIFEFLMGHQSGAFAVGTKFLAEGMLSRAHHQKRARFLNRNAVPLSWSHLCRELTMDKSQWPHTQVSPFVLHLLQMWGCFHVGGTLNVWQDFLSAPFWGLLMSLNVACLLRMTEPSRSCCLGTLSRLICEKSWVKLLKVFRIWRSVLVRVLVRLQLFAFPGAKVFTKNLGCHGIVEYHWEGAIHKMFCGKRERRGDKMMMKFGRCLSGIHGVFFFSKQSESKEFDSRLSIHCFLLFHG